MRSDDVFTVAAWCTIITLGSFIVWLAVTYWMWILCTAGVLWSIGCALIWTIDETDQ